MIADLALRWAIIVAAFHLACAYVQSFQLPWPLEDAFHLAGTAEEQIVRSLGVSPEPLVRVKAAWRALRLRGREYARLRVVVAMPQS